MSTKNSFIKIIFISYFVLNNNLVFSTNNKIKEKIDNYLKSIENDFNAKINNINASDKKAFRYEKDKFDYFDDMLPKRLEDLDIGRELYNRGEIAYEDINTINSYFNTIDSELKNKQIEEFNNNIIKQLLSVEDNYKFTFIINKNYPSFLEELLNQKSKSQKLEYFYNKMTPDQKKLYYKKLDAGYNKYMLDIIIKNATLLGYTVGTICGIYLTVSTLANFLQNISNNVMQPFFNRWGKHKNFLAKLQFEYIKKYNLNNLAGYASLKKQFKEIANELIEQKTKKTKMEGICLHGEPGNGKTQIIKALAGEAQVPLVIVNLNTLLNENGQIEENINLLFEEARKKGPCIILLDEFDLIAGSRKFGKLSDGEKAILNELLQQLDGSKPLEGVLVVANTNVIDNIDFALQRSGRLGRVIEVSAPKKEDINAIITLYFNEDKITLDNEITSYIVDKLLLLPKINVATIRNYINQIKKYMKKNKIKALSKNNCLTICSNII